MLPVAIDRLFKLGVPRDSRNGKVLQLPGPTLLCYERPLERVVFWPERDANPFFHFMESLWMLAGREDVEFLTRYVRTMTQFSDDGTVFNGAYGYRWRYKFGFDQLEQVIDALRHNHDCRRQVIQMWSADDLRNHSSKDVPCNTQAYVAINHEAKLDLTVCNRSNDLVWGALGANAVHFSFLLEFLAQQIGVPVGHYYQFTNNLHGYLKTIEPLQELPMRQGEVSPYELNNVTPTPIGGLTQENLQSFLAGQPTGCTFIERNARPMAKAYEAFRNKDWDGALMAAGLIQASDWRKACTEWLRRRKD